MLATVVRNNKNKGMPEERARGGRVIVSVEVLFVVPLGKFLARDTRSKGVDDENTK